MRDTERVPEYCTCGVQLPSDARFCHKCGKPQYEMPVFEEAPPDPAPELLPAAKLLPATKPAVEEKLEINFRNRMAIRVGLLAAALASLLTSLPLPMFLNLVWMLVCLLGAGFFAVYLYKRRTGQELTGRTGARLGWITGVFCFMIATVFFTITIIAISMQDGLASFYREQVAAQSGSGVDMEEFYRLLESPTGLATILLFSLVMLFFFFTILPTVGGAMGAKVLEKE